MNENYINGYDILERWFGSVTWTDICNSDDDDSLELMETINGHLTSLIFHIQNKSAEDRLQYELKFFMELCEQFEIPLWS